MIGFIFFITVSAFNPVDGVGSYALLSNPANLALPYNPSFSCKILDVTASVGNNSFNITQYNRYNGTFIDEIGKKWLLTSVPNRGLIIYADARWSMPRFNYRNWAVSFQTDAAAEARIPKDLIDLILNGNKLDYLYSSNGVTAQFTSFLKSGIGTGQRLGNFAVGVSLNYIRGLSYMKILNYEAQFITSKRGFAGEGCMGYLKAGGGNGWAIDVGGLFYKDRFYFGLAAFDLTPGIIWQEVAEGYWTFRVDSANLYELFVDLGKVEYRIIRSRGDNFVSFLPVKLNFGSGYHILPVYKTALASTLVFDIESFSVKKFTAELVSELMMWRLVALCLAVGFDSRFGLIASINTGLTRKGWTLDIGLKEVGGLLTLGRGVEVKVGIGYSSNPVPSIKKTLAIKKDLS
ncbi:MAG: hypothetical protein ACUVUD_03030 [bacterium]